MNTFYFGEPVVGVNTYNQGRAQLCVDRVRAAFQASVAVFPTQWHCQVQGQVDVIEDSDGEINDVLAPDEPAIVNGTGPAGFGPLPSMLLAQYRTNTVSSGKRLQGRAFLGPNNAGNNIDGSPDEGARAIVVAFGAALLDVGVLQGPRLAVWRRPRDARAAQVGPPVVTALPARDGTSGQVTAITCPDKFSVLRSRRD